MASPKSIAVAKNAGKTNKTKSSLVKCEVKTNLGEWISPESCQVFYIDEDAKFPEINFEIKTDIVGPYQWEWSINWEPKACPLAEGKSRFKAKKSTPFKKNGNFVSSEKNWRCDLGAVVGGDLIVKVKSADTSFIRKVSIVGKNPSKESVIKELDSGSSKENNNLVKKIFNQESHYRHFYSDEQPLTSFDNGYGLGQLTNPVPTYEQVWNWKEHIKEILNNRIKSARKIAKGYLDKHAGYSQEQLDLETLAAYNGLAKNQHYHTWDDYQKKWVENANVICDPDQSNKGWLTTEKGNNKTLDDLKSSKDSKPFYTGRCYAEHIKKNQN